MDLWVPPGLQTGRAGFVIHPENWVDSVFERMLGSVILQQFTASIANARVNFFLISVAACDGLLLLCDGKPQLRLLKNHINK